MEQLALIAVDDLPKRATRSLARDGMGRFLKSLAPPMDAEIATVRKAEFLTGFTQTHPNFSPVVRYRSNGQGIGIYDTMWFTDADLSGFFLNLNDDVLHCESVVQSASDSALHREQRDFCIFALKSLPQLQNIKRHFLSAHAFGFSVGEKMYRVVDRGQWTGAVIFEDILDKPQRWFSFDEDRRLRFLTQNDPDGVVLPQEKFVVNTFGTNSNPWGEPVLDLCYWPWYLKHHAMKNQGLWFEKWASPTAQAKYKWTGAGASNAQNRERALEVAMSFQNDQAIAIPEGIDISLLESTRSGAISFESYISQLTQMESRIVTGQLLASMGLEGGSYALGKVHAKQESNKVEMLAAWLDSRINGLFRELIDRNWSPQEAYPRHMTLAKSPTERQAETTIQRSLQMMGLEFSKAYTERKFQVVPPEGPDDILKLPEGIQPGQELPVSSALAAEEGEN
jgi:phage gp29-like protein